MMHASSCGYPAAFGPPPSPTEPSELSRSISRIPASTASSREPPAWSAARACSFAIRPKGQVETISGRTGAAGVGVVPAQAVSIGNATRATARTSATDRDGIGSSMRPAIVRPEADHRVLALSRVGRVSAPCPQLAFAAATTQAEKVVSQVSWRTAPQLVHTEGPASATALSGPSSFLEPLACDADRRHRSRRRGAPVEGTVGAASANMRAITTVSILQGSNGYARHLARLRRGAARATTFVGRCALALGLGCGGLLVQKLSVHL